MTDDQLYNMIDTAISKLERFSDSAHVPYVQPKIVEEIIVPPALEKTMRRKLKKYLRKRNLRVFFHNFRLTFFRIWRKLSLSKRIPRQ
jgi:hypothetical protein